MHGNSQEVRPSVVREIDPTDFSPTQRRMLKIFADGQIHFAEEFKDCLNDDMAGRAVIIDHINETRKKLRKYGYEILSEYRARRCGYRQVILLDTFRKSQNGTGSSQTPSEG